MLTKLTADQPRALTMLGLASISQEPIRAGGRTVSVTKLRITDAGRLALAIRH
jgi:hypothetical protein